MPVICSNDSLKNIIFVIFIFPLKEGTSKAVLVNNDPALFFDCNLKDHNVCSKRTS